MIEHSKHYEIAIVCGAKRGPKDSDLTFSPASLRDFLAAVTPPAAQRTWVDLTDEEIQNCYGGSVYDFARALLAKSKERNT